LTNTASPHFVLVVDDEVLWLWPKCPPVAPHALNAAWRAEFPEPAPAAPPPAPAGGWPPLPPPGGFPFPAR